MTEKGTLLENAIAWFVMVGVPVLWTAWCGAMLGIQNHQEHVQARAAVEACNQAAEATPGADIDARHEAYAVCMDERSITRPEAVTSPARQPG